MNEELVEEMRVLREERKRENKRKGYLMEKKLKEGKLGKRKDAISNQIYNSIEQFFA
jgi:hypothetical protein